MNPNKEFKRKKAPALEMVTIRCKCGRTSELSRGWAAMLDMKNGISILCSQCGRQKNCWEVLDES